MAKLREVVPRIRVGNAVRRHNLTVFELFYEEAVAPASYTPIGAAIRAGTARITEISEGGSVPTLALQNLGPIPVLIVDGEALIGARQNRIANVSILAPANQTLPIPVSCVERGRWSYRSREFSESPDIMFAKGRARKSRDVSHHLALSGSRVSNQSAVWDDISELSAKLGYQSPTDAMSDVYDNRRASIDGYIEGVSVADGQIGVLLAINESVAGVELFDSTDTLRTYLPKILRSYALDAISNQGTAAMETYKGDPSEFLVSVLEHETRTFAAVGLGEDLRLDSSAIAGGALSYEGRVVHLAAFNTSVPDSGRGVTDGAGSRYPLQIRRGHLLLRGPNGIALLDTGSPFSIGRGEPLTIAGRTWNPSTGMVSVLDTAGEHLHLRIDWLLGHDFFAANRVVIDWSGRQVIILDPAHMEHPGRSTPIELLMGVPVADVQWEGRSFRAIIDSGASLSYVPAHIVQGLESTGTRKDFYPGFGEFETNTYRIRAELGGRRFSMTAGVLPPMLNMMFGLLLGEDGWIVGSDFFKGRRIEIDYASERFVDLTHGRR